jgi:hypothetical protein
MERLPPNPTERQRYDAYCRFIDAANARSNINKPLAMKPTFEHFLRLRKKQAARRRQQKPMNFYVAVWTVPCIMALCAAILLLW